MDFQSAIMEAFAEAWVASNTQTPLTEAAEAQGILLSQASISGALPPAPSAGSSVATLHELTTCQQPPPPPPTTSSSAATGGGGERRESSSALQSVVPAESTEGDHPPTGSTSRLLRSPVAAGGTTPASSSSLGTNHGDFRNSATKQMAVSSKSIPVHCLVEQGCAQATEPTVELDSYAIIPSNTLFSDLVRTALMRLGYSSSEAIGARGAIQIKNWRPLTFDQITETPEATVGDILGELTTVAILRIRLYSRPKPNAASDVKEKLLQVLLAQSQSILMSSGCPIDQSMLAALSKGRIECDISEDTRKKFDAWYLQQVFHHCRQVVLQQQQHHHHQQQQAAQLQQQLQKHQAVSGVVKMVTPAGHPQQPEVTYSTTSPPRLVSAPPLSQHRTRIRTSFDPELELPKLHHWFAENQHPSRVQIQQYVKELNSLESRRGRKPLDVNNVVYWFKNARAAYKRAEQRFCSGEGGASNGLRSPYSELAGESHSHAERFDAGNGGLVTGHHRLVMGSPFHVDDDHLGGHNPESSTGYDQMDSGDENLEEDDFVHTLDLSVKRHKVNESPEDEGDPATPLNNISLDNINKISLDNKVVVKQEPHYSSSEQSMDSSESGDEDIMRMDHPDDGNSSVEAGTPGTTPRRESVESLPSEVLVNAATNGNGDLSNPCPNSGVCVPLSTVTTTTSSTVVITQGNGENGLGVCAPVQVNCLEERRKRNRTFIDPVTEVPRLEFWFSSNTHPSHSQIVRFTQELNCMPYRSKFPKLEAKNIQFWFKNRRAKCKRLHLANFPHNGVERLMQTAIRDTENAAIHSISAAIRESGNANNTNTIRSISAAM